LKYLNGWNYCLSG